MLLLEGFVHREALASLISRWMVDQPRPGDVAELKRIVNFNLYIARLWVERLARELLQALHGEEPRRHLIRVKGQLKDYAVAHAGDCGPRGEEMCARYRRFPEDFYREAPIDGGFYSVGEGDGSRLVGSTRIKRFRRIAEKGSRRIVDFMLERIRADADALADERARELGVARSALSTTPRQMAEEFAHAERRVLKSIRRGTIRQEFPTLAIPDVVGMKLIDEDTGFARLREALGAHGRCEVREEERHAGDYNATNLRIAHRLPRQWLRERPPGGRFLELLEFRGLPRDGVEALYTEFVDSAEDTVLVEIIVSTFQEFLESEIGRGMHEERILSQRARPDYTGHLATNVRYLLDYILGLCRGPARPELDEVPIKLWVKYMPDTAEQLMRSIYLKDELFFDTLPEV